MKLHPCALAVTGGLLCGIYTLMFTWFSILSGGYGQEFLQMWVPLHPGYSISFLGGIIGFVYSFVEMFFWLFIFGHVYNHMCKRCDKK